MKYCPNCAEALQDYSPTCEKCGAMFGPHSSWRPLPTPLAISEGESHGWRQALTIFVGLVFAVAAVIATALAIGQVSWMQVKARDDGHLEMALRYVREWETKERRLPTNEEFEAWTDQQDQNGFRYDGRGYSLDTRCGSSPLFFCISFWNKGGFVTYKSWKHADDEVDVDDAPATLAHFVVAAVLSALISAVLFVSTRTAKRSSRPPEG